LLITKILRTNAGYAIAS